MAEIAYRRAQLALPPLDAYSDQVEQALNDTWSGTEPTKFSLGSQDGDGGVGVLIIAAERGFCGRFPDIAAAKGLTVKNRLIQSGRQVHLLALGSRGRRYIEDRGETISYYRSLSSLGTTPYGDIETVAIDLLDRFEAGEFTRLITCANEPTGRFTYAPVERTLWPSQQAEIRSTGTAVPVVPDYDREQLFTHLVAESLLVGLYRTVLHSSLAEQLARISAMESASHNSEKLVNELSQEYLARSRQAETTALMEIVAGYEVTTGEKSYDRGASE